MPRTPFLSVTAKGAGQCVRGSRLAPTGWSAGRFKAAGQWWVDGSGVSVFLGGEGAGADFLGEAAGGVGEHGMQVGVPLDETRQRSRT